MFHSTTLTWGRSIHLEPHPNVTAATPLHSPHHESDFYSTSTWACHNTTAYSINDLDRANGHVHVHSLLPGAQVRSINMDVAAAAGPGTGMQQDPAKASTKPGSNTKRLSKGDAAKPKPLPNPSGSRFQCPKCPKTFSRIENLTRHQANRESKSMLAAAQLRTKKQA